MGNVKIQISGMFTRLLQAILLQKTIISWRKKPLEPLKISSGRGEVEYVPSSKEKNANILAPGPLIKKLTTLCFPKLLKLKKRKCPYFL